MVEKNPNLLSGTDDPDAIEDSPDLPNGGGAVEDEEEQNRILEQLAKAVQVGEKIPASTSLQGFSTQRTEDTETYFTVCIWGYKTTLYSLATNEWPYGPSSLKMEQPFGHPYW